MKSPCLFFDKQNTAAGSPTSDLARPFQFQTQLAAWGILPPAKLTKIFMALLKGHSVSTMQVGVQARPTTTRAPPVHRSAMDTFSFSSKSPCLLAKSPFSTGTPTENDSLQLPAQPSPQGLPAAAPHQLSAVEKACRAWHAVYPHSAFSKYPVFPTKYWLVST